MYIALLAFLCTSLAYSLTLHAMKQLSAFTVSLSMTLEPLYGIAFAWFLLALCCVFTFGDKRWVWLVSAFTIGHAISLALSVLNVVRLPSSWIEAMIPATIAFSCIQHLWPLLKPGKYVLTDKSVLPTVLAFGLIHGLGFSNFLRSMLGSESSIAFPLFSFHVGLEIGQILIILVVLSVTTAMDKFLNINKNKRIALLASPVLLLSLWMLVSRLMTL